jgi:hypothetical protein
MSTARLKLSHVKAYNLSIYSTSYINLGSLSLNLASDVFSAAKYPTTKRSSMIFDQVIGFFSLKNDALWQIAPSYARYD